MAQVIDKEVKLLFIQEELSKHGEWLCDAFTEAVERNKNIVTGDLLDSVNYAAFKERENPGLRFSFFSYGRAFEIAGYKRNKASFGALSSIRGEKQNKMRHKPTRWYASNMYGGLYHLISKLMYGLSDLEIQRLKGIIENRKNKQI